jgi:hypothetical protein
VTLGKARPQGVLKQRKMSYIRKMNTTKEWPQRFLIIDSLVMIVGGIINLLLWPFNRQFMLQSHWFNWSIHYGVVRRNKALEKANQALDELLEGSQCLPKKKSKD